MGEEGAKLRNTAIEIVQRRRDGETKSPTGKPDLLDLMLAECDPKTGQHMSNDGIVDNCLTFLFAGQDSTAAAMLSAMVLMAANPKVEAKLVQEISEVLGNSNELKFEHLSMMPYLDCILKETQRLIPAANFIMRTPKTEDLIGGKFKVGPDDQLLVTSTGLHYNKRIWGENAASFSPERWEKGAPHNYAYLPFASGPRACLGREFTTIEQKVCLAKLYQNFLLTPVPYTKDTLPKGYIENKVGSIPPFEIGMDVAINPDAAFGGVISRFRIDCRPRFGAPVWAANAE